MQTLTILSIAIASVGILLSTLGAIKFFKRKLVSGTGYELTGLFVLVMAGVLFLIASNLYTYERLVYEQPLAAITFYKISPQHFSVELKELDSGERALYELQGDEWQLDAQILTWHGFANLLGLDTHYRLHRLSGRYADIRQARTRPHTVHSLTREQRIDLWNYASEYRNWLNMVDATYGSAVFLPMSDDASYRISISRNGLVARPDNLQARQAVSNWIGL